MHRFHLFLLIASLVLCGCATSPRQPPPQTPPSLDRYLANECQLIGAVPQVDDYDILQDWVQDVLIPKYIDCAVRHRKTVEAWPK